MTTSQRLAALPLMLSGLAALCALLLIPQDVQAQSDQTPTVLVKNTGQPSDAGNALRTDLSKMAQRFTTGPDAIGFTLGSIGLSFGVLEEDISDAGDALSVTLNADDDGDPGAALCTLTDPASFTAMAVNTFDAPATCPALAASTPYFVVIERVTFNDADYILLEQSTSSSEDGGGAAGWSIDDNIHYFGPG